MSIYFNNQNFWPPGGKRIKGSLREANAPLSFSSPLSFSRRGGKGGEVAPFKHCLKL